MPKNFENYQIPASSIDTVPASIVKAGTVDSDGRWVTGTGTSFKSDKGIIEGDWIFSVTEKEVRRIERIASDGSVYLEEPFSNPLSGENLRITKASRARELNVTDTTGGASIEGVVQSAGGGFAFAEEMQYRGAQRDYPDPVIADATAAGGPFNVFIVY
jgi:hypothetical protein